MRKDFRTLVNVLLNDIAALDQDIEGLQDNPEMRYPYEMEREDCIMVLTETVKHYATDEELQQIGIAYGINPTAVVTMVRCEDNHTHVYIDWNDGNEDMYEYDLPLERMVKINKDLRFFRICF